MNVLKIIRSVCGRLGLPQPTVIVGNDDPMVVQLTEFLYEVIEDLADRGAWQISTVPTTFTTTAVENQGALSTLFPLAYRSLVNGTMYNQTTRLPVEGPITEIEWEAYKALPTGRIFPRFRMYGGNLYMQPAPVAGQTVGVEYRSEYLLTTMVGSVVTPTETIVTDNDIFTLSKAIMIRGLLWKWNSRKGLSYAEDFNQYEILVLNALGRDGAKATFNMAGEVNTRQPGILVPSGNWIVS